MSLVPVHDGWGFTFARAEQSLHSHPPASFPREHFPCKSWASEALSYSDEASPIEFDLINFDWSNAKNLFASFLPGERRKWFTIRCSCTLRYDFPQSPENSSKAIPNFNDPQGERSGWEKVSESGEVRESESHVSINKWLRCVPRRCNLITEKARKPYGTSLSDTVRHYCRRRPTLIQFSEDLN